MSVGWIKTVLAEDVGEADVVERSLLLRDECNRVLVPVRAWEATKMHDFWCSSKSCTKAFDVIRCDGCLSHGGGYRTSLRRSHLETNFLFELMAVVDCSRGRTLGDTSCHLDNVYARLLPLGAALLI